MTKELQKTPQSGSEIESWSKDDLEYLTELSSTFLPIENIAILIGVDLSVLETELENIEGEVYEAYQSGRLQTEFSVRKSVFDLAKAGSSPAQALAIQFIQTDKRKNQL